MQNKLIMCPKCGTIFDQTNGDLHIQVEAIEDWGYCLNCEHILAEQFDEQKLN